MILSAVLRPFAELIPSQYHILLSLSGLCWLVAFGLFVVEYGPMLVTRKQTAR
ncbi:NnrS protein [compost metagenome]